MIIQECKDKVLLNKMLDAARIQVKRINETKDLTDPEVGKELGEIGYEVMKIKLRLEELDGKWEGIENANI